MSKESYPRSFAELDSQILDGFRRFQQNHSKLNNSLQEAYTQGFIDGIRSNLEELLNAYRKDIKDNGNNSTDNRI